MRSLTKKWSIVIKTADNDSCVVAWDKLDYLAESESHLKDIFTFKEIKFGDEHLAKLVDVSNQMFKTCVRHFSFLTTW